MFSSRSRSQIVYLRNQLATTHKCDMTCAVYFTKMTGFADDLAAAGKKVDDEDLISYILAGLDADFNPFIENICGRSTPVSLGDMYAQMLAAEARIAAQRRNQHQHHLSVNAATRGRGRGGRGGPSGGHQGGRGDSTGRGRGGRGFHHNTNSSKPVCQLCKKTGHTVLRCYKRFDVNFTGDDDKLAGIVSSYGVDTNWYADSGAIDHINSDLDKLTTREKYHGTDQVHTANGSGMDISHVGRATISSSGHPLYLDPVLRVPNATKSLLSIQRFTSANNVFCEFHPDFFLVKDRATAAR